MKTKNYLILTSCILGALLIGSIGSIFNFGSIDTWYVQLNRPWFNPPNWIFGPVWTTLFILIGISWYLIIINKENFFHKNKKAFNLARLFFSLQWLLNILWSALFFYFKLPWLAFIDIILLALTIILTMVYFYKINRWANYLLWPYLLWVSFASFLNFTIWQLN